MQIAVDRGVNVIGTAGADNQAYLRQLGAQATTHDDGWAERVRALGPVHAALHVAGAGVLPGLLELTGDRQKVITIADLEAFLLGIRFSGAGTNMPAALARTVELVERGKLTIPIAKTYPLHDAAIAHADSQAGHTRGRRVLVV